MRFVIKNLPAKKSAPKWKVQMSTYKQDEIDAYSKAGHKAKTKESDLRKIDWARCGFYTTMSLIEAKERAKELNSKTKLEEERTARMARQERLKKVVKQSFVFNFITSRSTLRKMESKKSSSD